MKLSPHCGSEVAFFILLDQIPFRFGAIGMEPVRAARVVVASRVEVAFSSHVGVIESANSNSGIEIVQNVVVPCAFVWMKEQDDVRKLVVVVNDVRQVNHCLVPFVLRNAQASVRIIIIDNIDGRVQAGQSIDPRDVIVPQPSHHQSPRIVFRGRFSYSWCKVRS